MLGRQHSIIRRLRALRRDPALRRDEGVLVAEGLHLADEALRGGADVELAVSSPRLDTSAEGRDLLRRMDAAGWPHEATADATLESVQDARSPQPILLIIRVTASSLDDLLDRPARSGPLVVACGLQDPGNLGSLIRTADAAGAGGLIACGDGADRHHPRAVRASMGSILRLPCAEGETDTVVQALAQRKIRSVGTAARSGQSLWQAPLDDSMALWFGAEGAGLDAGLLDRMDDVVHVPIGQDVESLSVGAAAAVVLFEAARRRES